MENKIEVVYPKAKPGKRMLAHILDVGLFALIGFVLFACCNEIAKTMPFYKNGLAELAQIKNDTGLYVNGVDIITYVESDTTKFPDYESKKNEVSTRNESFYHNPTYFPDATTTEVEYKKYNERKKNATIISSGDLVHLFLENDGNYTENPAVSHEILYNWYKSEITGYSLNYILNNARYVELNKLTILTSVVNIIIGIILSFTIFYLILPLTCFKRGRQTIGMYTLKIGLISVRADNETTGKYIGRFFFMFLVFIPINFVSFLIPTFLSVAMMYFSKTNSSLVNYVFNDYMVDVTNKKIYFDALEREEAQSSLKQISIENRDLTLK